MIDALMRQKISPKGGGDTVVAYTMKRERESPVWHGKANFCIAVVSVSGGVGNVLDENVIRMTRLQRDIWSVRPARK